jgi:uncharacterized membrane protein
MKIVFRVDPNAAYMQFLSRLLKTISLADSLLAKTYINFSHTVFYFSILRFVAFITNI